MPHLNSQMKRKHLSNQQLKALKADSHSRAKSLMKFACIYIIG